MRPKSSSETFIWRKSIALTVPSVISSSKVSPVRLSVTVRVSSLKALSRGMWGWSCRRLFSQVGHRSQLAEASLDFVALEGRDPLGAELLDVERSEHGPV